MTRKTSANAKHSITLHGLKTSISLEPVFWDEIRRMAQAADSDLNAFVEDIDAARAGRGTLSSAIRLAVVADLKAQGRPLVFTAPIAAAPQIDKGDFQ